MDFLIVLVGLTAFSLCFWLLVTGAFAWRIEAAGGGPESPKAARVCAWLAGLAITIVALHFAYLAIRRHQLFLTFGYDLGTMDQTIWNTAHGRWLQYSDASGEIVTRPWRGRVELIYLPVALIYRLVPGPPTLLAVQSLALAAGAGPIFLLAREKTGRSPFALALTLSYLLHPALRGVNLHAFHANALAVPFVLAAFLQVERQQFRWAAFYSAATLACREDLAAIIVPLGIYVWAKHRQPKWGGALAAMGAAWAILTMVILPRSAGVPGVMAAGGGDPMFGQFAAGPLGLVRYYARSPDRILPQLFSEENAHYLALMLGPLGLLPLLSPASLIAGPTLLLYLLSGWVEMTQVDRHYAANILPPFALACGLGACQLGSLKAGRRSAGLPPRRALALALHLLTFSALFACWPPGTRLRLAPTPFWSHEHQRALEAAVREVPDHASVIASQHLMSHLSQRRKVVAWEKSRVAADCAVFDGREPLLWLGRLTPRAPRHPEVISPYPDKLVQDGHYRVTWARDGVVVMRRQSEAVVSAAAGRRRMFPVMAQGVQPASVSVGGLQLTGYRVDGHAALLSAMLRLRLCWQRRSGAVGTVALVLAGDSERWVYAHPPAFGLLTPADWPADDHMCEELILHLPAVKSWRHLRLGLGDFKEPPPAGTLNTNIHNVNRIQWFSQVALDGRAR